MAIMSQMNFHQRNQKPRSTQNRSTVSRFPIKMWVQGKVSEKKDIRVEKRYDVSGSELIAIMEIVFYGDGLPVVSNEKWVGTVEEFEKMIDFCNMALDERDAGGTKFPLILTERYRKPGSSDGRQ